MPCVRWVSSDGYADVRLATTGRCHILHEDAMLVSIDDLRGLPSSWVVRGRAYCCAELPCGHTFHVSALALSFLTGEMRCPLCRRGECTSMSPESIPERYRDDFLRRIMDMQDSSVCDYASEAELALVSDFDSDTESLFEFDTGSGAETGAGTGAVDAASDAHTLAMRHSDGERGQSPVDTTQWVRYYDYFLCERELRLVAELQTSDREMFVFESPVHFAGLPRQDGELVLDLEQPAASCVYMRRFYTQRTFCRHLHSKITSLGMLRTPLSLRFALTHPLFARRVEGVASSVHNQFVLTCHTGTDAAPEAVNVGLVRLNYSECSMSLVLEPHLLVSMWRHGLAAQPHSAASRVEAETSAGSL